jgi:hypothetical protein
MPAFHRALPLAFAVALACAAVAAPPAFARQNGQPRDELADLINAYRSAPGSCAGRAALPAAPLAKEPALARLRVGAGTFQDN